MKNKENYLVHYLKIIAKLTKSCIAWKSLLLLASQSLKFTNLMTYYFLSSFVRGKQPPYVFHKKGVLKNFVKFIGKHLCQRFHFNKVADLSPTILLKEGLWYSCSPAILRNF